MCSLKTLTSPTSSNPTQANQTEPPHTTTSNYHSPVIDLILSICVGCFFLVLFFCDFVFGSVFFYFVLFSSIHSFALDATLSKRHRYVAHTTTCTHACTCTLLHGTQRICYMVYMPYLLYTWNYIYLTMMSMKGKVYSTPHTLCSVGPPSPFPDIQMHENEHCVIQILNVKWNESSFVRERGWEKERVRVGGRSRGIGSSPPSSPFHHS